ncbi:hypothetical protein KPL70_004073 [Citrus sinensis]|nr:hypothetical protein KPL70_004073 [Citrus sinensis]
MIVNSAVIIGLWPAHFIWTLYCVLRTKRLGPVLKIVALSVLPVPLILWPIVGIVGSLLGGIGYGFFAPLIATFEAVGVDVTDKCYHCFASVLVMIIFIVRESLAIILVVYSLHIRMVVCPLSEEAIQRLSKLPSCLLATLVGVPVDVFLITALALWKSPFMLFKGWKRLLEDLIGREGPFLETVCVPFAGLAILLWPLAVVGAVVAAIISSFFLGLYAGVIAHQEDSLQMGLAYIVSVVSLFDEYVNDLLYLREGSCLPRILLRDGLINIKDVEECIKTGNCKKLGIKLPAWSILQCLLISAKSDSSGLVISDDLELTRINSPRDKVFEWFIGPLLIIKEQIKKLQLDVNEEISLRKLVMEHKNEKPDDWDNSDFPSSDNVRKAQLQAIIRRLQGIVASMSRIPTFRRRIRNLVKILYIEAIQASASSNHIGGITQHIHNKNSSAGTKDVKDRDGTVNVSAEKKPDIGDMV